MGIRLRAPTLRRAQQLTRWRVALRGLRALRTVSFIRPLRVFITAVISTLASMGNFMLLLLLIMYMFAIFAVHLFGATDSRTLDQIPKEERPYLWNSLDSNLLNLFDLTTVRAVVHHAGPPLLPTRPSLCAQADNWTPFFYYLDARGLKVARLYAVFYMCIGHFIFTNTFIGIIVQARRGPAGVATPSSTALIAAVRAEPRRGAERRKPLPVRS